MGELSFVKVVLIEPQGPQNLGACARACANFGVKDWAIVRPLCSPEDPDAQRFATGDSPRLLRSVARHEDLREAVSDCAMVVAFCGKKPGRQDPVPLRLPELAVLAGQSERRRIAVVFGNERTGIGNADLELCDRICRLETSEGLSSLNLSHALAIVLSRIFEAANEPRGLRPRFASGRARHDEKEGLYAQWREYLIAAGFDRGGNPERLMRTFRRMLERASPRSNEVRALRAMFGKALPTGRRSR